MVTHGRVELLAHPLSQKYLQMKWNSYGKYFHVTNLVIYSVYLLFVTLYASELITTINNRPNNHTTDILDHINQVIKLICNFQPFIKATICIHLFYYNYFHTSRP